MSGIPGPSTLWETSCYQWPLAFWTCCKQPSTWRDFKVQDWRNLKHQCFALASAIGKWWKGIIWTSCPFLWLTFFIADSSSREGNLKAYVSNSCPSQSFQCHFGQWFLFWPSQSVLAFFGGVFVFVEKQRWKRNEFQFDPTRIQWHSWELSCRGDVYVVHCKRWCKAWPAAVDPSPAFVRGDGGKKLCASFVQPLWQYNCLLKLPAVGFSAVSALMSMEKYDCF